MLREVCLRQLDEEVTDRPRLDYAVLAGGPVPICSVADLARLVLYATIARN